MCYYFIDAIDTLAKEQTHVSSNIGYESIFVIYNVLEWNEMLYDDKCHCSWIGHLPASEVHALHSVDIGPASVLSGPYGHNTHIPCYQVE